MNEGLRKLGIGSQTSIHRCLELIYFNINGSKNDNKVISELINLMKSVIGIIIRSTPKIEKAKRDWTEEEDSGETLSLFDD